MKLLFPFFLLLAGFAIQAQVLPSMVSDARTVLTQKGAEWRTDDYGGYTSVRFSSPLAYRHKDAQAAATAFLREHGVAVGLPPGDRVQVEAAHTGLDGKQYLRLRQYHQGALVLGGSFTLTLTAAGEVLGFSGSVLPATFFAPAAAPKKHQAPAFIRLARQALLDKYPHAAQWQVTEEAPVWTSSNPWHPAPHQPARLTRTFVVTEPAGYRAERVYLDAATGQLVLHHQLHCDLNRRLLHRNANASNTVWREGDLFPGNLNAEDQEALTATAEFYHLMHRTFGRRGFDDKDGEMRIVTNATLNNCPNAVASGNLIRHCAGVVGDDIVAHELTHNYLSYLNGLIYAFESGAINEAFADIFGESLDLLNDRGNDTNDDQLRTGCAENNVRWLIAEDATAIDTALRDMWLPTCKSDPANRDSLYFVCTDLNNDSGGVHSNSGLVNRTFSLLTDGGSVGMDTVRGIGLTKALHIFHHASRYYLTQVTDFYALADLLVLAAQDLAGTNLPALTLVDLPAMASDSIIRASDIEQLERAIRITQLRGVGPCPSAAALAQYPPDNCASASINAFGIIVAQDWEDSLQNWSVTEIAGAEATWQAKPWRISGRLPDGRPGLGAFAPNPQTGNCNTAPDYGQVWLTSPLITLPATETEFVLSFDHYFTLQEGYDGGLLFFSRNDGVFQIVTSKAFLFNGYNKQLQQGTNSTNPLAGEYAFSGSDHNSTSGTWGRSIVDLNSLGFLPGDDLQLRWVLSYDGCDGRLGWYLDDIKVGYCGATALPVTFLSFAATPVKQQIELAWSTSDEAQNAGFQVERRAENTSSFQQIGWVPGGGSPYAFTDGRVEPGTTYVYRLRQIDQDGTAHYSQLVSARLEGQAQLFAYPNPAREVLFIRAERGTPGATLYSAAGRRIADISLNQGTGQFSTRGLPAGIYVLRVANEVLRVVIP